MRKIYSLIKNISAIICLLCSSANAQTLTPCSGTPGSNTIVPLLNPICLGMSGTLTLANGYNVSGITYQWQSSTVSIVGPFSSISGATTNIYVVPTLTQTTYFNVVITCTNSGQSINASGAQLSIATTVTNSAPYFEGFQGISFTNQFPNCSWAANNLGSSCLTFTNAPAFVGNKCAGFYHLPIGANYFYTNGILLKAGITYSASVWYNTTSSLTSNWSNLSIMLGTTQSTNGLTNIASINNPATNNYTNLSNTFTVASTGIYYVAIKGTSTNTALTQYLYWDDLSITIPCTPLINPVTLAVTSTPNSSFVCAGQPFTLTASGAHTYLWSNGLTFPIITSSMSVGGGALSVVGTNTLTGCTVTSTAAFFVNPSPVVSILPGSSTICIGQSTNLNALGASTYTWSTGATGNMVTVSPLTNTVYSVIGSNQFGCTGSNTLAIAVRALPNIIAFISSNTICAWETVTLSATGANTYQWTGNAVSANATLVTASPSVSGAYTVTGVDNNGCSNISSLFLTVNSCLSVSEFDSNKGITAFPNPNSGDFEIKTGNNLTKAIELFDVSGRLVLFQKSSKETIHVDFKDLPNGVYYLNVSSSEKTSNAKIIKH